MSPEILSTLITAGGIIFSTGISWCVARHTANKELERMKLSWEHDDVVASDDEFSEMAAAVSKYLAQIIDGRWSKADDAIVKVAALRAKEIGALANALDVLYAYLLEGNTNEIQEALTKVIEEKRNAKSLSKEFFVPSS